MNLKDIVRISVLLIIIVGYFLYEKSKETTYEEIMAQLINEEEVEHITVYSQIPLVKKTASVTINDTELINSIINEQIKLKKIDTRDLPPVMSTLVIYTDKDSYNIGLSENSIMIGTERYLTTNPVVNPITMILVKEDLDWEIIEYTPFIWK